MGARPAGGGGSLSNSLVVWRVSIPLVYWVKERAGGGREGIVVGGREGGREGGAGAGVVSGVLQKGTRSGGVGGRG